MKINKNKLFSNISIFLFCCIVFSTAFLTDFLKSPKKNSSQFIEQTQVFNSKELDEMSKIIIKNKTGEFVFEKSSTGDKFEWLMTSPKTIKSSSIFIENFFQSLKTIKLIKYIEDTKINNSNFSIDKPTATVTLSTNDQKVMNIDFGIMNSIDHSTYVRILGKQGILHIEAPTTSLENLSLSDLIESKIFQLLPSDIKVFKYKKKNSKNFISISKSNSDYISDKNIVLDSKKVIDFFEEIINLKSSFTIEEQTEVQKKELQKIISNNNILIQIETNDSQNISFSISQPTQKINELTLNEEPHNVMTSTNSSVIYIINKETNSKLDLSEDFLNTLEVLL
jgi:hypothetical protein